VRGLKHLEILLELLAMLATAISPKIVEIIAVSLFEPLTGVRIDEEE